MVIPLKDGFPTLTASKRHMAACRSCGLAMTGIYNWNLRYFCEACEENPHDETPKPFMPKLWSGK